MAGRISDLEPNELFIAIVAAVGTDVGMVCKKIELGLRDYRYQVDLIRVSDFLIEQNPGVNWEVPHDEWLSNAMDAGDRLRGKWKRGDALALHAISDIVATRQAKASSGDVSKLPRALGRHAFVIRSLKTPDELVTLREVYGPRLLVIAAYSPKDQRIDHLGKAIEESRGDRYRASWSFQPEDLVERDEKEHIAGGQDLRGTFHLADYFIRAWDSSVAEQDIERCLEIAFGSPFRTPTRDEHGQFLAAGAALRSSEMGRQVGAAITTKAGSLISVGTNEVPIAGGGSHWEEDGDGNREFEVEQIDSNRRHFDQLASQMSAIILDYLSDNLSRLTEGSSDVESANLRLIGDLGEKLPSKLLEAGLNDLTEFGRAVHAEMSALLDAAQRGVSVTGATLYTTTFPCHNCARHIVGAGISKVVFIEPYTKSRAEQLHKDSVSIAQMMSTEGKVQFEPFVGVAPRRYMEYFDAGLRARLGHPKRKDADGRKSQFDKGAAQPMFTDVDLSPFPIDPKEYRLKEVMALVHLRQCLFHDSADPNDKMPIETGGERRGDGEL